MKSIYLSLIASLCCLSLSAQVASELRMTGSSGGDIIGGLYPYRGHWAYSDDGTGYGPAWIHTNTNGTTHPTMFLQTNGDRAYLRVNDGIGLGTMSQSGTSYPTITTSTFLAGGQGQASYFNNGGNVGVGTSSPLKHMHLKFDDDNSYDNNAGFIIEKDYLGATNTTYRGNLSLWSSDYDASLSGEVSSMLLFGSRADANVVGNTSDLRAGIGYAYNGDLTFHARQGETVADGAFERMRIDGSTGFVGIGTTTPSEKMEIQGHIQIGNTDVANTGLRLERSNQGIEASEHFHIPGNNSPHYQRIQSGKHTGEHSGIVTENYFPFYETYVPAASKKQFGFVNVNTKGASFGFNDKVPGLTMDFVNGESRVGIGTTEPVSKFQVSGGSNDWNESTPGTTPGSIHLDPENQNANYGSAITFGASDNANGETAQAGIYVRSDGAYGSKMYFSTSKNYNIGSQTAMMIDYDGKIGIGTINIPTNYKLAVNGNGIFEEVKVKPQIEWPDYVFAEEYELPSLEELSEYIKINKHLPNVPDAETVREKGVFVGEMNAKLLEKVEELTLYTIAQERQLKQVEKENEDMKTELKELKTLVKDLIGKMEGK